MSDIEQASTEQEGQAFVAALPRIALAQARAEELFRRFKCSAITFDVGVFFGVNANLALTFQRKDMGIEVPR
jgi:hypothetical protein